MSKISLTAEELSEIAQCIEWGLPLPPKYAPHFSTRSERLTQTEATPHELVCFGSGLNGLLMAGDNLTAINGLKDIEHPPIKLIYIDPPFDVGSDFNIPIVLPSGHKIQHVAYSDTWGEGAHSFLHMLAPRLKAMVDLLDDTGSIVVHCDYRTVAQIRLMLDRFLGAENFRNEIVWHYTGGGRAKKYFSRKHDSLLWYSKSDSYTFNLDAIRVPYKATSGYARGGIVAKSGKHYRPNPKGTPVDDVWDIPIINPMAKERVGYPTQKPIALLERIILALTNEGDCVADFFCGSGTTLAVAAQNRRQWIGTDRGAAAIATANQRLNDQDYTLMVAKTDSEPSLIQSPELVRIAATIRQTETGGALNVTAFETATLLGLSAQRFQLKDGLLYDKNQQCLMKDTLDWIQGWMVVEPQAGRCVARGEGRPQAVELPSVQSAQVKLILIDITGGLHIRMLRVTDV